ncbi:MAG: endonuclease/exonuclease/phosphatase family protein [Prevotella sp.]|jgi:endonuclease/exonuclease/phosphatase family metal-dependent hydrolase|nr:endonuclease/exonuclease/phosphatase family protein [Prevotella sp.]
MKKHLSLLLFILATILSTAQNLKVASYNVRYDNNGDAEKGNGWAQRFPVQCALIKYNAFDIFGAQEVLHNQLKDITGQLTEYDYIGVGRDDGKTKGEYAPIFYRKDRFVLLNSGHFWLSENTDYPNKGWDAALPRICTWGHFADKAADKNIWFFNLHMDHVGVEARKYSAQLVLKKIEEMCAGELVILTGDFNVDQTHESYKILHDSPILDDSYETADIRYALNGTFNSFNVNLKTDSRIDHIFVSPSFSIKKYAVLTDTYRSPKENGETVHSSNFPKEVSLKEYAARIPSDHFPVVVELDYTK